MRATSESESNHDAGSQPPAIEAGNLVRRFGDLEALAGVSFRVRAGEFFSLLGPSGCGKTTLLRIIAGLECPDAGSLKLGGLDAAGIPAHRRPVNTVFQSYALFPHLSVCRNVEFGLRMKGVPPPQIATRVDRVMALLEITELAARTPAELSGGQKQRVALARALVNEPAVLLLDEPLGALDLKLRKQLQDELHQLQRRLGITFIHVTHDQDEALVMSDRIAVMNAGRIEQIGEAEELYERPRTRFVAQFLGSCNLIEGGVKGVNGGALFVQTEFGELNVSTTGGRPAFNPGANVTLAIRPEKVRLADSGESNDGNCVRARLEAMVYCGAETQYRLRCAGTLLNAVALNSGTGPARFRIGQTVACHLSESALMVLDD